MQKFLFLLLSIFIVTACDTRQAPSTEAIQGTALKTADTSAPPLDKYWYQGKGEVSRYELQQNRYQDVHPGEVVLIFVTEDFLTDKQVKNERYQDEKSVKILKTNQLRRFTTGLYDYSVMTSVFTPVDTKTLPRTLKATNSTQDWCGQAFMQLNWRDNAYQAQIRSYFEQEHDQNLSVSGAVLEDELFNRIRLNPAALPTGQVQMVPSLSILRLLHQPFQIENTEASLAAYTGDEFAGADLQAYRVRFPRTNRTLEIVFENKTPYHIAGWSETYPDFNGQVRRTVAKKSSTVLTPYWQQNRLEDMAQRSTLGVGK